MSIRADLPLYGSEPFSHAEVFGGLALVGFVASALFIGFGRRFSHHKAISQVLLALWVLGPPLWFFYEHFFYFPRYGNMAEGAGYEKLAAAQDVTSKVWAAFALVLGALYKKEAVAPDDE